MNEKYLRTFIWVWPFSFLVGIILFLVGLLFEDIVSWNLAVSFLLGSFVNSMLMSMNFKSLTKHENEPVVWAKLTRRNYLLRYLIYGLTLGYAYLSNNFYFLSVFAGFFTFKIVLLLSVTVFKGGLNE
jgi:hypothetical protein